MYFFSVNENIERNIKNYITQTLNPENQESNVGSTNSLANKSMTSSATSLTSQIPHVVIIDNLQLVESLSHIPPVGNFSSPFIIATMNHAMSLTTSTAGLQLQHKFKYIWLFLNN